MGVTHEPTLSPSASPSPSPSSPPPPPSPPPVPSVGEESWVLTLDQANMNVEFWVQTMSQTNKHINLLYQQREEFVAHIEELKCDKVCIAAQLVFLLRFTEYEELLNEAPGDCPICSCPMMPGSWFKCFQCVACFHKACLSKWILTQSKETCPVCRDKWI